MPLTAISRCAACEKHDPSLAPRAIICYLVIPVMTPTSRVVVRGEFPPVRGGRIRSSAARANRLIRGGFQWPGRLGGGNGIICRPSALRVVHPTQRAAGYKPCARLACSPLRKRRPKTPTSCWIECMLWGTISMILKSIALFDCGSLGHTPRFCGEPPVSA